jgi:hypothetical protein
VCPFLGCIFDHPKGHTVASQRMKLLPGWWVGSWLSYFVLRVRSCKTSPPA